MSEPHPSPETPKPRKDVEYEDPHYHDDDDILPSDDVEKHGSRPPIRRKLPRKFPTRRHYDED
jgi:hypothetical protein